MAGAQAPTMTRTAATIDETKLQELSMAFRGQLIREGDSEYDEARQVWNAMIDKRPALIARCTDVADVMAALAFAREMGLPVAIRGAGHNIAGNALCDGGVVIDQSGMKAVRVDPEARRAWVEPGATLGDLDHATQAFGLATPVGINSTTGVAGLTLGGGIGWLSRKYGLSCDNLVSADVVTADGEFLQASEDENADLFWAIRGGGGNFGIVTGFEFKLYPVGPEVLSGLIVYPFNQAKSVLTQYRDFVKTAPDDLTVWAVARLAPPLPFLPTEVHGTPVLALAVFYAGDIGEGEKLIEPLRKLGTVLGEHIGPQPYTAWQQAFDPLLAPGSRNYWKSHNFAEFSDAVIDSIVEYGNKLPSTQCEIFVGALGGQAGRVAPDAMAYPHRDANFVMNVHGRWETAQEDERGIGWARDLFAASAPYATGGVYVNFMTEEETDRVRGAYGPNYERLVELKTKYDPHNLFRLNQNIAPRS